VHGSKEALSALCSDYLYPLYAFARRRGHPSHDAQDLTQGFFLSILKRHALKLADPARGKFRSFLLGSFQNFLADESDRAGALKRGGGREFLFLDAEEAESRYELEQTDQLTAEKIFDARWAMTLLTRAEQRLQEEYATAAEATRFEVLRPFVGVELGRSPPTYEEVARALGVSLGAAKTTIHRFRKQYIVLVRQEVSRTVSDPAEIDEEIRALCEALAVAEGRL
jgi:RNA polymerase sigma factor (sigma-70 family)